MELFGEILIYILVINAVIISALFMIAIMRHEFGDSIKAFFDKFILRKGKRKVYHIEEISWYYKNLPNELAGVFNVGDVYDSFAYNPRQRACFKLRSRIASGCLYVDVDEDLIFLWKGNGHIKFKEYEF